MKFYIYLLFFTLFFSACSTKQNKIEQINDITRLSQKAIDYTSNISTLNKNQQNKLDKSFNKIYFKPWEITKLSFTKKDAMWGFKYSTREMYGQNYKKINKQWFNKIIDNTNFDNYNKVLKKAITIKNSNLRVLPSNKPMFLDPKKAGEGFPFDYNQNSSIYINTPLLISHYSKDKAWAFVESNFALGWIDVNSITIMETKDIKTFKNNNYAIAIKDNFPIYKNNIFIEHIKLGTLFPIIKDKYIIVGRDSKGKSYIRYIKSDHILKKPIELKKENIVKVLDELINEPYGWGGLIETRDCSSMTRDLFSPFGIYLERNSYGQTLNGNYISLEELSNEDKKKKIIEQAKPFMSLLYAKGHVMLYVGYKDQEPIIFHQFWGIRTKDDKNIEGRYIIGKSAFTTLEVGKELKEYDSSASLIKKIKGIVILN